MSVPKLLQEDTNTQASPATEEASPTSALAESVPKQLQEDTNTQASSATDEASPTSAPAESVPRLLQEGTNASPATNKPSHTLESHIHRIEHIPKYCASHEHQCGHSEEQQRTHNQVLSNIWTYIQANRVAKFALPENSL